MKHRIAGLLALLLLLSAALPIYGCKQADTEAPSATQTPQSTPVSQTPADTDAPAPSTFLAKTVNTRSIGNMNYWLYTPSAPTEAMPLIVYLHGGSGKGDDPELITNVDGFPKYLRDGTLGNLRAYVIIPQLPSSQKGWANIADAVRELIDRTVSAFAIDKSNISLTGHSMGGTGTWSLALSFPTLFARIAPLSGSVKNLPEYVGKLKSVPVWAFVGSTDTIVPPDSSIAFVDALKAAGGNARITVFDGADHFSVPALTYTDSAISLTDWLIGKAGS